MNKDIIDLHTVAGKATGKIGFDNKDDVYTIEFCQMSLEKAVRRIEELEQQLKELPKKIIAEIYDLAYDKILGYDGYPKTTEINFLSLENILEQVQKKYTKE